MSTRYVLEDYSRETDSDTPLIDNIFESRLPAQQNGKEISRVGDSHIRYGTTHLAYDFQNGELNTSIYGEKEEVDQIIDLVDEIVDQLDREQNTSITIE